MLLKVLEKLVRGLILDLEVFGFEVFPDIGELNVGVLAGGSGQQIALIVHI